MEGQIMTDETSTDLQTPPALLAIMRAARRIGDRQLERAARQKLLERYGIDVRFRREQRGQREEASCAD
jgi:hypothetical protein